MALTPQLTNITVMGMGIKFDFIGVPVTKIIHKNKSGKDYTYGRVIVESRILKKQIGKNSKVVVEVEFDV